MIKFLTMYFDFDGSKYVSKNKTPSIEITVIDDNYYVDYKDSSKSTSMTCYSIEQLKDFLLSQNKQLTDYFIDE